MNYKDARPLIKSGDLLAFSHGSWLSLGGIETNLVRICTRSTYSHVGVAWVVAGRVFVLEAVKPKIRIFPLSQSGGFYLIGLDAPWKPETETFALSCVGKLYSNLAAIDGFLNRLTPHSVQQCAAYVMEVLCRDGIAVGTRTTPDSIVQKALENGGTLVYVKSEEIDLSQ